MIQTYSTTIRRKEMDAVLTCMVDEKIGPGELNGRFIQLVKDFFRCDGAVALRSPGAALKYALKALGFEAGGVIMISALAPAWQIQTVEELGFVPLVLDVDENTGLVTPEIVSQGVKDGGRLLLLHETMGILPDMDGIMQCGIPVIEDVSQSAGAEIPAADGSGNPASASPAGSFGVYSILCLEEHDVVTAGGGAVLMAPRRREWLVLKKAVDAIARTELLPDINCALGWIQLKEFRRNEAARKAAFALYQQACLSGRHKLLFRGCALPDGAAPSVPDAGSQDEIGGALSTMACFPLVLNSPFKDVRQYAARKEVEVRQAYEDSVIALREDQLSESCIHAKSLYLRCALFPLYPRLSHSQIAKIVKVLGTLP
ncbi:MAG: DegT/DnrJ/EryC1/StrS family aminotransferase [Treponemataceae bacterium]|nr:DegT/DnrJ/EryC1/StrS family aminotransferase [Treponemataceae bacterium]